ncbi:MAG: tetratricopeptide repeat protein [Saprospiraceae bacterium]
MNIYAFFKITARLAPALLLAAAAHQLQAQNTLQGRAQLVPEAEVEKQSLFVDAEKERLLGKMDKAVELYKKFLFDNPANDAAWYGLARTYYAQTDESNALEAIAKAIALAPNNEWYRIFQADLFEKSGKNKDALAVYAELVRRFPQTPAFFERLAFLQLQTQDPKSALKTLDQLEKLQGVREKTS